MERSGSGRAVTMAARRRVRMRRFIVVVLIVSGLFKMRKGFERYDGREE